MRKDRTETPIARLIMAVVERSPHHLSYAEIQAATGAHPDTIKRTIRALVRAGKLERRLDDGIAFFCEPLNIPEYLLPMPGTAEYAEIANRFATELN